MNTLDALRLSVIENGLAKAQQHAAEMELVLEVCVEASRHNEFSMPVARLLSAARGYRAAAEHIEQIATTIRETK